MSYCHECGEKVAQDDVYCPYCGIALQNASGASSPNDNSLQFEATVVDLPAPVIRPVEKPAEPAVKPEKPEEVEIKDISLPLAPKEFNSGAYSMNPPAESNTSENIPFNTEEVPDAHAHLPQNQQFSEKLPLNEQPSEKLPAAQPFEFEAESSESKNFEESKTPDVFDEPSIDSSPAMAKENDFAVEQPSVNEVIGQDSSKFQEKPSESPAEPDSFDSSAPVDEIKPAESTSYNAADERLVELEAKVEPEVKNDDFQIGAPSQPFEQEIVDENLPATLISTPLPPFGQKLEEFSGRNAETQSASSETSEKPSAQISKPLESSESASAVAQSSVESAEDRSNTSPNVNSIDTGGKKAKLKTLSEGTVLNGRYEIVRKIGGGGMGAVYLASDKNLGGVLRAVKEMVQSYIEDAQQEKAVNDFKRESLLLTSLEHPAIPTIYDYFYDEKEARFYLVMKYISGGDLAARLRSTPEGRLDETSVTMWALQIADVLDYLHNRQPPIVYRDLKPSNIMIDGNNGKVMLIDFGIARWVNKEEKGVTAVGTMGYAPPELFSGNVESRSDIYSLGSTMFHLLTGADPQNNPLLIFDFQKHPRPRQINPQLSDQIDQILMRAVEYNAEKRSASAGELRDLLSKHLDNLKFGRVTFGMGDKAAAVIEENLPVFCGFCGQRIVASDMFCPFCGAKQPLADASGAVKQPSFITAPRMTARLYIENTTELDAPVFNLEKDTNLLGRRDPMSNIFPEVDLSKFDPQTKISRRHARIWRDGEVYMVEDLGSSNGTVLMTKKNESLRLLPQQPRAITHGDKLKLGDTTLHFVVS